MMDTPICDFVRRYTESDSLRLHMPGHKGVGGMGVERLDITEISGADSLYEAEGIIRQSEENASRLFGCPTYYSTEGASHCIRAMLHLATAGRSRAVAAVRNVHRAFLTAAALLDLQVSWIYPGQRESYLSCTVTPEEADRFLAENPVSALYVTSPDYLGNMADISGLAQVCHSHGVLLLVDNAHGAYLRFLRPSLHPMDLGADMCCSSAHKTLPVLTGGAYLQLAQGKSADVKAALALFGSTSPSYLILQSLDMANRYLAQNYEERLAEFVPTVAALRHCLAQKGWELMGEDPLRLTFRAKASGYTGTALAQLLRERGIECELADPDYLVLMLTPSNGEAALQRLWAAFEQIPILLPLEALPPEIKPGAQVLTVRQAMLAPAVRLPVADCVGRVLADASIGCPPAVPILVCGEQIHRETVDAFQYYGITECSVVEALTNCPDGRTI